MSIFFIVFLLLDIIKIKFYTGFYYFAKQRSKAEYLVEHFIYSKYNTETETKASIRNKENGKTLPFLSRVLESCKH